MMRRSHNTIAIDIIAIYFLKVCFFGKIIFINYFKETGILQPFMVLGLVGFFDPIDLSTLKLTNRHPVFHT